MFQKVTGKEVCHLEAVNCQNYTAFLVDETNMSKLHLCYRQEKPKY